MASRCCYTEVAFLPGEDPIQRLSASMHSLAVKVAALTLSPRI